MKLMQPERFQQVIAIETLLSERQTALGKDPIFFHSKLKPLAVATADGYQPGLPLDDEDGGCESGYCWT